MFYCSRLIPGILIALIGSGTGTSADTLRCQTINTNTTCAGSSGVSCQTINGRKICVSGQGDVVQSTGNPSSTASIGHKNGPKEGSAVHRWREQQDLVSPTPGDARLDDND